MTSIVSMINEDNFQENFLLGFLCGYIVTLILFLVANEVCYIDKVQTDKKTK